MTAFAFDLRGALAVRCAGSGLLTLACFWLSSNAPLVRCRPRLSCPSSRSACRRSGTRAFILVMVMDGNDSDTIRCDSKASLNHSVYNVEMAERPITKTKSYHGGQGLDPVLPLPPRSSVAASLTHVLATTSHYSRAKALYVSEIRSMVSSRLSHLS